MRIHRFISHSCKKRTNKWTVYRQTTFKQYDPIALPTTDEDPKQDEETSKAIDKAIDFYLQGNVTEAIKVLQPRLSKSRNDFYLLKQYASLVAPIPGRYNEAYTRISQAIAVAPKKEKPLLWAIKAFVHCMANQYDQAIVCAVHAVETGPRESRVHTSMAMTLAAINKHEDALYYYNQASRLAENDPWIDYLKGRSLYILNQKEEAYRWLQNTKIEHCPLRSKFYVGVREYRNKCYSSALANFEQAVTGTCWNVEDKYDVISWKGECYLAMNNPEQALENFDKAIVQYTSDALSYHGKGEAFLLLGNNKDAQISFEKARSINPLYHESDYLRVKNPI